MAKLKHIAIATNDADKAAKFYKEVFGLKEVAKVGGQVASGYHLTDGNITLTLLDFKNDEIAGPEYGKDYSGLHHIGFQVESIDQTAEKLKDADSTTRDDLNTALGIGMGTRHGNAEVKYGGPDGVIIDISEGGWVGSR